MPKRQSLAEALKERPPRRGLPGRGAARGRHPRNLGSLRRRGASPAADAGSLGDRTLHDVLKEALNNLFASRSLPPIA